MKGKQRLLRGNFRCVSNNEGRKQKAVQNQWNSSCEFLNTNLLYPPQKALKNLIRRMCYRKTLYKACHDCFCREKLIQKGKFFLSCSVLKTKSYSEKQQNKKYPLCCSVALCLCKQACLTLTVEENFSKIQSKLCLSWKGWTLVFFLHQFYIHNLKTTFSQY